MSIVEIFEIWVVLVPSGVTIVNEPGSTEDSGSAGLAIFRNALVLELI